MAILSARRLLLAAVGTLVLCFGCCSTQPSAPALEMSVYQFQEDDQPSDSYLQWEGDLQEVFKDVRSLTICARLRFFSVWEVSRFIQLTNEDTGFHAIQIDVDVRRIRVSVGGLRRYHNLDINMRALTWHHLCVTLQTGANSSSLVTTFMDGERQDEHFGGLSDAVTGTILKIGAGDAENNFHGQITQVNIWSRPLLDAEIERIASCQKDMEGDVIPWTSQWTIFGKVVQFRQTLSFFCKTIVDPKHYLFPQMDLYQGFTLCEGLGGDLPSPENKTNVRATFRALSRISQGQGTQCKGYWLGVTDEEQEGTWRRMNDGKPITPFWKSSEPDGGKVQNCARGTLENDLDIEDIPCDWKQCVLCVVHKLPVWSMLGACQIHDRNRLFAVVQHSPGELLFEGYSYYTIEKRDGIWYWVEKNGMLQNRTIATLMTGSSIRKSWPIGRHSWRFEQSVCDEEPGEVRTLLLSPCEDGHFTCDDATCIPLYQRCDLKPDCRDGSDEKNCRLVQFPSTYRSDIPPGALIGSENPLQVALHVTLESADINTASMMMHTNYNLTMTWSDQRLEFLNLNEDRTLNRVKQEMVEQVWVPVVDFTNTKGNHYTVADHEATMMVNMQSAPTLGDDSHSEEEGIAIRTKNKKNMKQCAIPSASTSGKKSEVFSHGDDSLPEEVEVYPGTKNSLSIRRKYSKTFQCQFDLTRYPFDKQGCEMELTMLSASSRLLQFDERATVAEFSGNRHLIEYTVGEVKLHFHNDRDFAVLFVEVELVRRAGFILMNVYIPSMCLLVISYLTLYFKPAIFQVRMLGSLTTLLVMATLFTQASSQLPKSSYFKLVDVWLLSSILIIFTIIVFHAIIDRLQDTPKPAIPKHPLSAIIIKPDLGHCRSPHRKPGHTSPGSPSIKSVPFRSRSKASSKVSSPVSNRSVDSGEKSRGVTTPTHSLHDSHELVTTFSRLGVVEKEGCSASGSTSTDDSNRKRLKDTIKDNCNEEPAVDATQTKPSGGNQNTVGKTYREPDKPRKRDSFVAMERADAELEDDEAEDDYDNSKFRRRIEWRCWKWSCKDVDKCKTMILTSRIVVLIIIVMFNIVYWSVALGPE